MTKLYQLLRFKFEFVRNRSKCLQSGDQTKPSLNASVKLALTDWRRLARALDVNLDFA